jgi:hypothetical protein
MHGREEPHARRRFRIGDLARVVRLVGLRGVVAEPEEALRRIALIESVQEEGQLPDTGSPVFERALVFLVLGGRFREHDQKAPFGSRIGEEPQMRVRAGRLVVAKVGREHVTDLVLLVEEEHDREQTVRIALVRVEDDLGNRDEARRPVRVGRGERCDEQRPDEPCHAEAAHSFPT